MKKWEIIKSTVVHKNKYFSVGEEEFKLSNGKVGKYYIVHSSDAVAVVAVDGGDIYFIETYRYILRKKRLEIPMGGVEKGETPFAAAKRELAEETGITAKKIKKIGSLDIQGGRSDQKIYVYIAEGLSFGEQKLDEIEKAGGIKTVKFKISEIPELIRTGKITDSHTIASFSLFMLNYKGQAK